MTTIYGNLVHTPKMVPCVKGDREVYVNSNRIMEFGKEFGEGWAYVDLGKGQESVKLSDETIHELADNTSKFDIYG